MFSQYHVLERIGEGSFGKVMLEALIVDDGRIAGLHMYVSASSFEQHLSPESQPSY